MQLSGASLISRIQRTETKRPKTRGSKSRTSQVIEDMSLAKRLVGKAFEDEIVSKYQKLQKDYRELAAAVRMIRRATDRAHRGGVLPPIKENCENPKQECEAIARAIYRSVRN